MILCCGEALIDMLPGTLADGRRAFAPHVGGSVFNTAVALGRLGVETGFLGGLSTDPFGRMLGEALAASHVSTAAARFSDLPTALAFVQLEDGQASYFFYDENTAGRMLAESDLPALGVSVEALYFGCISLVAEPCGTAFEALARREHQSRVVMLDPNIRPAFIADRERHRARLARLVALADIVKLSEDDLGWFGAPGATEQTVAGWLGRGPRLVVLTRGGAGAEAWFAGGHVAVPAHAVAVADTVGAGDTFSAALLAALADRGQLTKAALATLSAATVREALFFAAEAAAVTVSRPGANPPWRHELAGAGKA